MTLTFLGTKMKVKDSVQKKSGILYICISSHMEILKYKFQAILICFVLQDYCHTLSEQASQTKQREKKKEPAVSTFIRIYCSWG